MLHTVFTEIKAETNLAKLFNKYLDLLSTIEMVSFPTFISMKDRQENIKLKPENADRMSSRIYDLIIVNNSLNGFYNQVVEAISLIEEFLYEYKGDWKYYASAKRFEFIQEHGSDDDSDFDDNGNVVFKDNNASLEYHTFHRRLGYCFDTEDNGRGEYLGTSSPDDFEEYTRLVMASSQFCITKFFASQGQKLQMHRQDENGNMIPLTLGDEVEDEMNKDIQNRKIGMLFTFVLYHAKQLNDIFQQLDPYQDNHDDYYNILCALCRMTVTDYNTDEIDEVLRNAA